MTEGTGWAAKIDRITLPRAHRRRASNVAGRRLTGPCQGFGKMWQKAYSMDLGTGISPQEAIATWKTHFAEFWPDGSSFHGPLTGISPGEVALLDVAVGGGARLSTGVFVLYADDVSFTLMTPEGHMFAGWITFSARRAARSRGAGGARGAGQRAVPASRPRTVVQAEVLMRANDPLYEIAMMLGGHRKEDQFWAHTMTALGRYLGAPPAPVVTRVVCVDPRRQWRYAGSLWLNSLVRSQLRAFARLAVTAAGRVWRPAAPRSAARPARPAPSPQPPAQPAQPTEPTQPAGPPVAGRSEPTAR
jgi:hypothetical protein